MNIYSDGDKVPPGAQGCAVALGNFDGVHLGHAHLFTRLRADAPAAAPLGALTFAPHPRAFFRPDEPSFRLMTPGQQARALAGLGVENMFVMGFTPDFAALTPEDFVNQVLLRRLGVAHVACGADFSFGRLRAGDASLLAELLAPHGVGVTVAPAFCASDSPGAGLAGSASSGAIVSSTRIRALLAEGAPERAAALLGRPWAIEGEVVPGDRRGRLLGFPTANIRLGAYLLPAHGVYAVRVRLPDGREVPGVTNIGCRPTINDGQESRLEAHLFDIDEDLYGQTLEVALHHRLREEKRFDGLEALKAQIAQDAAQARQLLGARPA